MISEQLEHPVILFDGVCNFCDASVNFIIDHDPKRHFKFTAQQLDAGQEILRKNGLDPAKLDTLVLSEDGKIYTRSTAALRIAKKLSGGWKLFYVFILIPRPIRDVFYNLFAQYRYKLFGKKEACRVPTATERARFI